MNKANWFLYGFFTAFFLFSARNSLSLSPQLKTSHSTPEDVNAEFNSIYTLMQTKNFENYTSTPTLSEIQEFSFQVITNSSGSFMNILSKSGDNRFYVPMTKM